MKKTIPFEKIHPFIRYAQLLPFKHGTSFTYLKAYDCRFFYVYNGEGVIWVDDVKYNVSKGHLFLWQPNIKYHLLSQESNPMELIGFNFDFTQNNCDKSYPIPPDKVEVFDENQITESITFSDMEAFNRPIYLKDMQMLENDLLEIKKEFSTRKKFFNHRMSGLFLSSLGTIARVISSVNMDSCESDHKIDMIIQYIHQHYNMEITNKMIGRIFNFHPNYINKLMVLHTGTSLHQYVLMHRISQAISLLQTTDMPISEIAYTVGFKDINHFSKYFKQKTGRRPGEFR